MPKSLYSEEFKSEAIKQIIEDGHGVLEVSRTTGVSDVTLYKWLKAAQAGSPENSEKRKNCQRQSSISKVMDALFMAVKIRKPKDKVLIHSGQGCQFTSYVFNPVKCLQNRGNSRDRWEMLSFSPAFLMYRR